MWFGWVRLDGRARMDLNVGDINEGTPYSTICNTGESAEGEQEESGASPFLCQALARYSCVADIIPYRYEKRNFQGSGPLGAWDTPVSPCASNTMCEPDIPLGQRQLSGVEPPRFRISTGSLMPVVRRVPCRRRRNSTVSAIVQYSGDGKGSKNASTEVNCP